MLLFTYSIVMLHAIIPHCHAEDAHSTAQHVSSHTHVCDHHSDDSSAESHTHQVCQSDDLHGNYLKSETDSNTPSMVATVVRMVWSMFTPYVLTDLLRHGSYEPHKVVHRGYWIIKPLRGPPAFQ